MQNMPTCPICLDDINSDVKIKCGCPHYYHGKCLQNMLNHCIDNDRKMQCVECKHSYSILDLTQFKFGTFGRKLENFFSKKEIERRKIFNCPKCKFSCELDGDVKERVNCPGCTRDICLVCKTEWHAGITCETNLIRMFGGQVNTCPKCKVIIHKDGGCNHVTCKCGFEFWWSSRQEFKVPSFEDVEAGRGLATHDWNENHSPPISPPLGAPPRYTPPFEQPISPRYTEPISPRYRQLETPPRTPLQTPLETPLETPFRTPPRTPHSFLELPPRQEEVKNPVRPSSFPSSLPPPLPPRKPKLVRFYDQPQRPLYSLEEEVFKLERLIPKMYSKSQIIEYTKNHCGFAPMFFPIEQLASMLASRMIYYSDYLSK